MDIKKQVLDIYFAVAENYAIRTETFENRPHIVVPVVMMVEGVHRGSHGPILHLADELGRHPESWNGIPVTIGHPDLNGVYVSANNPDILHDWCVGRIFNTQITNSSLRAEAWLDESNLERISEDTLKRIKDGEVLEVSIGIFSDEEPTTGIWNNEQYNAIARNHRPDHLALLPDEIGACSIEDGCGIRVNKKGETKVEKRTKIVVNEEVQSQVIKELNHLGFFINEVGHNEVREKVAQYVYGLDYAGYDNYVEEVYDDYFVFSQLNHRMNPRTNKLFKQGYTINEQNELELNGEPIQVKREIKYKAIETNSSRGVTERVIQKNSKMSKCVKTMVDNLIANKNTAWNETHREYLESQTEEHLELMTPPPVQVNTKAPTREDILNVLSEKPMTTDEFLSVASAEVKSQIEEGLALRATKKTEMVEAIATNSDVWKKEELEAKDMSELQKLHSFVVKETEDTTVYLGNGGIGGNTRMGNYRGKKTATMLPSFVKTEEN